MRGYVITLDMVGGSYLLGNRLFHQDPDSPSGKPPGNLTGKGQGLRLVALGDNAACFHIVPLACLQPRKRMMIFLT